MSPEIPEGSVVITPAQVYDKVITLTEQVTKLLASEEQDKKAREDFKSDLDKLRERVGALEQKVWLAAGFCAAGGSGAVALIQHLAK